MVEARQCHCMYSDMHVRKKALRTDKKCMFWYHHQASEVRFGSPRKQET